MQLTLATVLFLTRFSSKNLTRCPRNLDVSPYKKNKSGFLRSSSVDFTERSSVTSMEDLGFSMPRSGSEKPSL